MSTPTIEQYLLSTCLFIIDKFNEMYKGLDKSQLKIIADNEYNELDICSRIATPFGDMVHYSTRDSKKKADYDLYVKSKHFKIRVKYPKNFKSKNGTNSCSVNWDVYQNNFNWLENEIKSNKGKCAFIIGWFNCVEKFSQIIQLGFGKGSKPIVDEHRLVYFPFLRKLKNPTTIKDLDYDYDIAYKSEKLKNIGVKKSNIDCMFLGNENDKFHFAIYF